MKTTEYREWAVIMLRPGTGTEIGPQTEKDRVAAKSKTEAIKSAKLLAKRNEWRFMFLIDDQGNEV